MGVKVAKADRAGHAGWSRLKTCVSVCYFRHKPLNENGAKSGEHDDAKSRRMLIFKLRSEHSFCCRRRSFILRPPAFIPLQKMAFMPAQIRGAKTRSTLFLLFLWFLVRLCQQNISRRKRNHGQDTSSDGSGKKAGSHGEGHVDQQRRTPLYACFFSSSSGFVFGFRRNIPARASPGKGNPKCAMHPEQNPTEKAFKFSFVAINETLSIALFLKIYLIYRINLNFRPWILTKKKWAKK